MQFFRNFSCCCLLLTSFLLGVAGCQLEQGQQSDLESDVDQARPVVIATNYPLANIAFQLAGEWIDVQCPAPAGEDPAFWTPKDSQIPALQQADLVLLNEAGHEPWRKYVTLSPLNVTFTSRGFRDQWIKQAQAVSHQHGPEGEHTHADFASTTWLDPVLFQEQVHVIGQSLIKLLPNKRTEITTSVKQLQKRLDELDQQWKSITKKLGDRTIIASHPVYQYLEKRYGWKLQSLHWEPNQKLTEADWASFDQLQVKSKADLMLWEDEPGTEIREKLSQKKVSIIIIKPLGNGSLKQDVIDQMRSNAQRFEAALEGK